MSRRSKFEHLPRAARGPIDCPYEGRALLQTTHYNKGSAFPEEERKLFKLHGLLPPSIQTLEEQVERAYEQYSSRHDDLAKNIFMASMKVQNEVLYYKLLQTHLKEMFGVIYTPTEADAIQNYSRVFRKPEGCYLSIEAQDRIDESLDNFAGKDEIDYIVVTDGEQILGIGDQGVGGILISSAKLAITTVCGGIHPWRQIPVVLDCGTDNEDLLNNDLYLGVRHRRVRGKEYDDFVDRFVKAVRKKFTHAYIHFEDFGVSNAKRILERYSDQFACFNDDIQGTGCVTLAAMTAALRASKVEWEDVRVVCFGAGSAGTGIADQICDTVAVRTGKSKQDAATQVWCVDKGGLLLNSQEDTLNPAQVPFARDGDEWADLEGRDLHEIVKKVKPHVLIGTSTKPGAFTEDVVREMAKHVDRPIIFPLSNPTRLHEAKPKDLISWTDGQALVATGSPFPPVEHNGVEIEIAECNNSTVFPGIGLGAILSRTSRVSTGLLVAATQALADKAPILGDDSKPLLPDVEDVRELSVAIAKAVIRAAVEEDLAQMDGIPSDDVELDEWIRVQMWDPEYQPFKKI